MGRSTVLNRFEQTGTDSNKLILGGPVESEGGFNLNERMYNFTIPDITTGGIFLLAPGFAGAIVRMSVSTELGTNGIETISIQINNNPVIGGGIVMNNTPAFDITSSFPTSDNIFTANQSITVSFDGLSTLATVAAITIAVVPT